VVREALDEQQEAAKLTEKKPVLHDLSESNPVGVILGPIFSIRLCASAGANAAARDCP